MRGVVALILGIGLAANGSMMLAVPSAWYVCAAFLSLHALVRLWDATAGREHAYQLLLDVPTIFLPPVLAFWITSAPGRRPTQRQGKYDDQVVSAAMDR